MLKSRLSRIILFTILLLGIIYVLVRLLFFQADPLWPILSEGISRYQLLAEQWAGKLLAWAGSAYTVAGHVTYKNGTALITIDSGVLLKRWFVFLLLIIWLTPVRTGRRISFSLLLLVLNFIMAVVDIALLTRLSHYDLTSAIQMSRTPGVLTMTTFFVVWVWSYRDQISNRLSALHIDASFMHSGLKPFFVVLYLYVILGNPVLGYFAFKPWVDFLFLTTQKLLSLFHVDSALQGKLLIGEHANLYMGKACLGMKTILLFAAVVYLTGRHNLSTWLYMFFGVVFINMVNIIRLALLFNYVQKHPGYDLAIDVHDMYDYIIYTIIFILWVIWFEWFTGIRRKKPVPD
ncbi:MAG TPA: hypothetical protein VE870_15815 [Bacteroidales bacterium]|nr:hypothetical protein [Bacteroidales bacterium]